jgi:hypothetical protein
MRRYFLVTLLALGCVLLGYSVLQGQAAAPENPDLVYKDCAQLNPINARRRLQGAAYEAQYKVWVECRSREAKRKMQRGVRKGSAVKSYGKTRTKSGVDVNLGKASDSLASKFAELEGSPIPAAISPPVVTPQAMPAAHERWSPSMFVLGAGGLGLLVILLIARKVRMDEEAERELERKLQEERERRWVSWR